MVEDADWQVYFSERSAALSFFNIKIMINNIVLLSIVFNYILLKALEAGMFDESTKLCDIKYKIVFLGQSSVGKSAIIERFIQNRYDPNKLVPRRLFRKLLASTSWSKMFIIREEYIDYNFGTLLANKNSKV